MFHLTDEDRGLRGCKYFSKKQGWHVNLTLFNSKPIKVLMWEFQGKTGSASEGQRKSEDGVPIVAQWLTNLTRNHEVEGSIPGLAQWVGDPALL